MSLDEARQWFEIATVLCKFLEGGETKRQKVLLRFLFLLYVPKLISGFKDSGDISRTSCKIWIPLNEIYYHVPSLHAAAHNTL